MSTWVLSWEAPRGGMAEGRRVKPLSSEAVPQNNGISWLFHQLRLDLKKQIPSHSKGTPAASPAGILPLGRCSLPYLQLSNKVERGLLLPQPWSPHLHVQGKNGSCQPPSRSITAAPSPKAHLNYWQPVT